MNASLLASTRCFFGGGTRIVLELDEYRESLHVDFLCSDRAGYRTLRSMITQSSFGELFSTQVKLMREIRADMYGIRTFLDIEGQPLKFEIISEGRVNLSGVIAKPFPTPALDQSSCFAEKLLANADRGRDQSTRSRDLIDLAFMSASWPREDLQSGLEKAVEVYGDSVERELIVALEKLDDRVYRKQCIEDLAVSNARTLSRGLQKLRKIFGPE